MQINPKGRKGFEIQFNWIFVLVAGAAILLFFSLVAIKLKDISESSRQADIVKGIEAMITSASVSIDTTNVIEISDSEIKVDCTSISSGQITKQYQNLMIFSPSLIKGENIVVQTLAFIAPFRSSGLLFATSDKLKYVIVGTNALADEINKTLPKETNKEFIRAYPASIRDSNAYRTRLVITDNINIQSANVPSPLEKMNDGDATAIKITGDTEKGILEFYGKQEERWVLKGTSQYMGKASMMAAVYADTKELYECGMKNAFSRHNLVSKIHIDRTQKLKDSITDPQECNDIYANSILYLNSISDASARLAAGIIPANMQNLYEASVQLSAQNKEAQKFSCPLVY